MKRIVNFSGGLCSFWAAKRVVEKYGTKDVVLLFADTLVEDDDLYEFNEACAKHLGIPITRVSLEMTPWQLFRQEGIIGNSKSPVCSIQLKREVLDRWTRENCMEMNTVVYIGMDWSEEHRVVAMRARYPFWNIEAPMTWQPIWDKARMVRETQALGIKIPRLYGMGFPHNNCGGRCVAAGITHWVTLYHRDRAAYMEWAEEERITLEDFATRGIQQMTMLKDRRGGITQNLSLYQLRDRIEAGEKFSQFEWGGCGCGTMWETPTQTPSSASLPA